MRDAVLDPTPDPSFDRIAAVTARLVGCPMAVICFVGDGQVWLKASHGTGAATISAWPDAGATPGRPALTPDLAPLADQVGARSWAGVPLVTRDRTTVGALCVLDTEVREIGEADLETLEALAELAVDQLELRVDAATRIREETSLREQAESMAVALQSSLLPPRTPDLPGMELAMRYQPGAHELAVGGDFYDVFRVGANDWGLVIGDVCGKGARAASLTALARWTIRGAAVHAFLPSRVLSDVNEVLLGDAGDVDDRWCSAAFARVELDECGAWVTLVTAGHPRPVVVRRAGWIDVRGHVGMPLGLFPDPVLADDRVGLGPGDALVLFTDGITETRDRTGELFAEEALPELLLDECGTPADELADRIVAAAKGFAGGRLRDDVAVVVLRVPDDADETPLARLRSATGVSAGDLPLPGYPVGEVHTDVWAERPAPPREARTRLPPDPAALIGLRELLRRLLASWRMEELADGDLELLATELAANGIAHAGTPLTVIVRYLGDVIRVEVGDGSRELARPRAAAPDADGGRGLVLVSALSSAWGTVTTKDGKRVWCDVPASPPATAG